MIAKLPIYYHLIVDRYGQVSMRSFSMNELDGVKVIKDEEAGEIIVEFPTWLIILILLGTMTLLSLGCGWVWLLAGGR